MYARSLSRAALRLSFGPPLTAEPFSWYELILLPFREAARKGRCRLLRRRVGGRAHGAPRIEARACAFFFGAPPDRAYFGMGIMASRIFCSSCCVTSLYFSSQAPTSAGLAPVRFRFSSLRTRSRAVRYASGRRPSNS